uniref:ABC transporter n=1 Tax=Galdieria sulphuraria TaxID=130081 RepID=A0A075W3E2_GALSU|nr:ABC transporter [Galdieria sulphuraria]AIG92490.1 ABC transporter [Galdieria sulphuraria]
MNLYDSSMILKPNFKLNLNKNNINKRFQEILALNKRFIIQTIRRPITFFTGMIQPILWLILFGALFRNIPVQLFVITHSYTQFLIPGIIVFTVFSGALNSGLTIIFDREFGFFNRLLVAPLISKSSIIISSMIFMLIISILQAIVVIFLSFFIEARILSIYQFLMIIFIISLLAIGITAISLSLAFVIPGHIEFLALILIFNLPLLFSSTALAPLSFMPLWLQIISSINPLSFAIEGIRYFYLDLNHNNIPYIMDTIWGKLNLQNLFYCLLIFDLSVYIINIRLIVKKLK